MLLIESKARGWKAVFGAMNSLHEEATFRADETGIFFYCLESSHNCSLEMFWPKSNLAKLEIDSPQEIGFKISEMNKIFSRIGEDADVRIEKLDTGFLRIETGEKKFEPRLINLELITAAPKIKIDYKEELKIDPKKLNEIVKDILIFNEHMIFEIKGGVLYFRCDKPNGKYETVLGSGYSRDMLYELSIDYFSKVIDPISSLITALSMNFGWSEEKNKPWPTLFLIGVEGVGEIKFYLAPILKD